MLCGPRGGQVRPPGIVDDAIGPQSDAAGGSDDAAAPIAEDIAIGRDRHRRAGHEVIWHDDVGRPGEMGSEDHDHRRRLREVVDQFEADTNLHLTISGVSGPSTDRAVDEWTTTKLTGERPLWFRTFGSASHIPAPGVQQQHITIREHVRGARLAASASAAVTLT